MIELDLIKFSGRVLEVAPTVCGVVGNFVDDTWSLQLFTSEGAITLLYLTIGFGSCPKCASKPDILTGKAINFARPRQRSTELSWAVSAPSVVQRYP